MPVELASDLSAEAAMLDQFDSGSGFSVDVTTETAPLGREALVNSATELPLELDLNDPDVAAELSREIDFDDANETGAMTYLFMNNELYAVVVDPQTGDKSLKTHSSMNHSQDSQQEYQAAMQAMAAGNDAYEAGRVLYQETDTEYVYSVMIYERVDPAHVSVASRTERVPKDEAQDLSTDALDTFTEWQDSQPDLFADLPADTADPTVTSSSQPETAPPTQQPWTDTTKPVAWREEPVAAVEAEPATPPNWSQVESSDLPYEQEVDDEAALSELSVAVPEQPGPGFAPSPPDTHTIPFAPEQSPVPSGPRRPDDYGPRPDWPQVEDPHSTDNPAASGPDGSGSLLPEVAPAAPDEPATRESSPAANTENPLAADHNDPVEPAVVEDYVVELNANMEGHDPAAAAAEAAILESLEPPAADAAGETASFQSPEPIAHTAKTRFEDLTAHQETETATVAAKPATTAASHGRETFSTKAKLPVVEIRTVAQTDPLQTEGSSTEHWRANETHDNQHPASLGSSLETPKLDHRVTADDMAKRPPSRAKRAQLTRITGEWSSPDITNKAAATIIKPAIRGITLTPGRTEILTPHSKVLGGISTAVSAATVNNDDDATVITFDQDPQHLSPTSRRSAAKSRRV